MLQHFTKSLQFHQLLNTFSNQTDKNICFVIFLSFGDFFPAKTTLLSKQHCWQKKFCFTSAARVRLAVNIYHWPQL